MSNATTAAEFFDLALQLCIEDGMEPSNENVRDILAEMITTLPHKSERYFAAHAARELIPVCSL